MRAPGHEHHANGHGMAVRDGEIAASLDGVADSVAEIEELARAGIPLILGDVIALDAHALFDDLLPVCANFIPANLLEQRCGI